jgi:hypothetical protein
VDQRTEAAALALLLDHNAALTHIDEPARELLPTPHDLVDDAVVNMAAARLIHECVMASSSRPEQPWSASTWPPSFGTLDDCTRLLVRERAT